MVKIVSDTCAPDSDPCNNIPGIYPFVFAHVDPTMFIICGGWNVGDRACHELRCPTGLVWSIPARTCVRDYTEQLPEDLSTYTNKPVHVLERYLTITFSIHFVLLQMDHLTVATTTLAVRFLVTNFSRTKIPVSSFSATPDAPAT